MGLRLKVDFVFGDFGSIFGEYGAEKKSLQWCIENFQRHSVEASLLELNETSDTRNIWG